jgi:hypothetical protein
MAAMASQNWHTHADAAGVLCALQAQAFAVSGREQNVQAYALAVADAINTGGDQATQAYAAAFSSAYAGVHHLLLLLLWCLWTLFCVTPLPVKLLPATACIGGKTAEWYFKGPLFTAATMPWLDHVYRMHDV